MSLHLSQAAPLWRAGLGGALTVAVYVASARLRINLQGPMFDANGHRSSRDHRPAPLGRVGLGSALAVSAAGSAAHRPLVGHNRELPLLRHTSGALAQRY